jgi:hypothetical protein
MPIVYSSIHRAACIAYILDRPKQNLLMERDLFSGRFNVLDAS